MKSAGPHILCMAFVTWAHQLAAISETPKFLPVRLSEAVGGRYMRRQQTVDAKHFSYVLMGEPLYMQIIVMLWRQTFEIQS